MKLLSPRAHGYVDYGFVVLLLVAPMLLHFGAAAAIVAYVVAALHLAVSMLTHTPFGSPRTIAPSVHAAIELGLGLVLAASPWLFGFYRVTTERRFFVISGLVLLGVLAMTRYAGRGQSRAEPFDRYGE